MDTTNTGWGGARANSGRKKTGKAYKTVSICGTEQELDVLKGQAKDKGKTLSRYIIDELVPPEQIENEG